MTGPWDSLDGCYNVCVKRCGEEEKEFEARGTLSPTQPRDDSMEYSPHHVPDTPMVPSPAPQTLQGDPEPKTLVELEEGAQVPGEHPFPPPNQLSVPTQTTPERHRRSATEPVSIASPIPPTPDTPTRFANGRKRKSGLRSVIRKMFGRKSREVSDEDEVRSVQRPQTQRSPQRVSVCFVDPRYWRGDTDCSRRFP